MAMAGLAPGTPFLFWAALAFGALAVLTQVPERSTAGPVPVVAEPA